MKRLLIIFGLLFSSFAVSQNLEITLDYFVDYEIINSAGEVTDTMTVGFSKDSDYLWSDFPSLGKEFAERVYKKNNIDLIESTKTNLLYDTSEAKMMFYLETNENIIFVNLKLETLFNDREPLEESATILDEETNTKTTILNKEHSIYRAYPDVEPDESIYIVYDKSIPINNNKLFNGIIAIALNATKSNGNINVDIQDGLILKVSFEGTDLIRAIKLEEKTKKINVNYSFKISE